jgi:hypothetical protein
MAGDVPFLMKDLVLLAVSICLLKHDLLKLSLSGRDAGIVTSRLRVDAFPTNARSFAEPESSQTREIGMDPGTGLRTTCYAATAGVTP